MRPPATADERERRLIAYLKSVHQGRIREFKLSRLNRIGNFRKQLMQLIDAMIEARAEDLAAGMLMEYAAPAPEKRIRDTAVDRLAIPGPKRVMPAWIRKSGDRRFKRG